MRICHVVKHIFFSFVSCLIVPLPSCVNTNTYHSPLFGWLYTLCSMVLYAVFDGTMYKEYFSRIGPVEKNRSHGWFACKYVLRPVQSEPKIGWLPTGKLT